MGEGLMARKNLLAGISERKPAAVDPDESAVAKVVRGPSLGFTGRGAFGAVTKTIDDLAARADAAKELEARIAAGDLVVELDPSKVDRSFIVDRMREEDDGYAVLLEGIRVQGQSSPILVRPHPNVSGRYQVAFGHRRLRAAAELGKPVRAVVKQLSDRDLVLAQGQENSARADLSFIERARFARHLEAAGYDRETIMSALSVDKTTVSRLISVASQLPEAVIDAIGPAPGTGRDRWLELCGSFQNSGKDRVLDVLLRDPTFLNGSSDSRFHAVQEFLRRPAGGGHADEAEVLPNSGPRLRGQRSHWSSSDGVKVAKVTSNDRNFILSIDRRVAPHFGDYLLDEMGRLYEAYSKKHAR
jgi:ParB family transcriptional regulator, chromosome partitioning protein